MPTLHNVTIETTLDKAIDAMTAQAEKDKQWEAERKAKKVPRYVKLHREITRHFRGVETNSPYAENAERSIMEIMKTAPSGSGFDSGTKLTGLNLKENKHPDWLRFETAFHHMNDGGYYDGWTEHTVTVKPDLSFGFDLSVSGRNKNEIKEYIAETFQYWLSELVSEFED